MEQNFNNREPFSSDSSGYDDDEIMFSNIGTKPLAKELYFDQYFDDIHSPEKYPPKTDSEYISNGFRYEGWSDNVYDNTAFRDDYDGPLIDHWSSSSDSDSDENIMYDDDVDIENSVPPKSEFQIWKERFQETKRQNKGSNKVSESVPQKLKQNREKKPIQVRQKIWTMDEENQLRILYDKYPNNWKKIANIIGKKSSRQVQTKFRMLQR